MSQRKSHGKAEKISEKIPKTNSFSGEMPKTRRKSGIMIHSKEDDLVRTGRSD
jgi:hypothetical protein